MAWNKIGRTGGSRIFMATKCKNCFCDCHCSVEEHSDENGVCVCPQCMCQPGTLTNNNDECESCQ